VEIDPWWVLGTLEWLILLLNTLKIHFNLLNFQNQKKDLQKNQVEGDIPPWIIWVGTYPPSPLWRKPWVTHLRVGSFAWPGIDIQAQGFSSKDEAIEVMWLAQGRKRGGPWRVLNPRCSDHELHTLPLDYATPQWSYHYFLNPSTFGRVI
jgi:hypothetical protein